MAKSYFYDEGIADWRELVKGEQGERGPVGPRGPQGPAIDIETGLPITVDNSVGTRVFVGDTMIHGDTGRRYIVSELMNGWTTGLSVSLYRTNDTVTLELQNGEFPLDGSNATSDRFLTLPRGFRPGSSNYVFVGLVRGGSTFLSLSRTESDLIIERGVSNVHGLISWKTTDPWPASLPGTPT